MTTEIRLGDEVRDLISGFVGIVVGRSQYLTRCDQYLVEPPVGDDNKLPDAAWFDIHRLLVVQPQAVVLPTPAEQRANSPVHPGNVMPVGG